MRGAYYKISTMSEEESGKGLITASAGNHAQGVAYAAQKLWLQGYHCHADDHASDQSEPYQELRGRCGASRGCL